MDIGEECGWDSLEGIDVQGRFFKPFKSLNLHAAFLPLCIQLDVRSAIVRIL